MKHTLLMMTVLSAMAATASVGPDPTDATTLLADVAEGQTETYAEKIDRKYAKFVKVGKGTLVLTAESSKSSETDFMGTVEIREGILESQSIYALKECSHVSDSSVIRLSVSSNAQLRITFSATDQNANAFYNVGIAGDGPDGKGAIVFNGVGCGDNLIRHLHLTGDASIGGTGRFGVGYYGFLYLDGHTLTATNPEYYFRDIRATADHAGHFVKKGGYVTFQRGELQTYLRGSAANTFTLDKTLLTFWSTADLEASWTLKLLASPEIRVHGSGQWAGPVVGDGGSLNIYSDNADAAFSFCGGITNVATLRPNNSGGRSYALNLVGSDHHLGELVIDKTASRVTVTGGLHQVIGSVVQIDLESTLKFIDAGDVLLTNGESKVYAGTGRSRPARLEVRGNTVVTGDNGTRLMVGDHSTASWASAHPYYWGSLTVADGAAMTNDIYVAYRGLGAVYQRHAEICEKNGFDLGYGSGNKDGVKAYGYWGASHSHLTVNGQLRIAAANATGAFVQQGGLTELSQDASLYVSQYGHAMLHVGEGGVFRQPGGKIVYFGGSGDGGSAAVTVEGEGSLMDFSASPISWMVHKNFQTHLNLNDGGVFSCYRMQYEGLRANLETSRTYLSFNGGCLRMNAPSDKLEYRFFMSWTSSDGKVRYSHPDLLTVYEGGAVFDVATSNSLVHFDSDILGPTGKSITAIALPTDEDFLAKTHLGALRVVIEDTAGGEGASAYVAFDDVTGKPSKVVITSPGVNYHEGTTTAKVMPMRGDEGWDCAVSLADAVGGGLVKKGPGTLILRGRATYPGATTVCEGQLYMTVPGTLPQGQPLVMAGGQMDYGTNINLSVSELTGFGSVTGANGVRLDIANTLGINAADAAAGRTLKISGLVPTFADGATVALDAAGLPEGDEPFRRVVVQSAKAFVGNPAITGVPKGWYLRFSADRKRLVLGRECGLSIIVR